MDIVGVVELVGCGYVWEKGRRVKRERESHVALMKRTVITHPSRSGCLLRAPRASLAVQKVEKKVRTRVCVEEGVLGGGGERMWSEGGRKRGGGRE